MKGFEWDEGNIRKNWVKHRVSAKECEQIFFNIPIIIFKDVKHSLKENRFGALGKTEKGRKLHIIFVRRGQKIRVVSARDQNKREKIYYDKNQKT